MEARMKNPAMVLPDVMSGIQTLTKAIRSGGVPQATLELVHMRASQINGCAACINIGTRQAATSGESTERLLQLPAWREASCYSDAERAALEMTEAATRLADTPAAVTDAIWDAAAKHFDERGLSAIILMIAITNFFNRINTTVREPAEARWA
ncbi:alkyl hydroperoxide reductase AhpD [Actinomadura sp. NBRC 104412]|uniref:carboxymuconolactone decarboxylase family protein n=1 Tax=Actinomadura sp. NBRC 104412 TaxID=3032203 RepID=UPI0024A4227E|nr:carboxymuconolactone decarboxylase family protein [Actinomadura sp. NBRC 104412]GLZ07264.1 alkyl hydroperoxide reductase AhpD [Actinomadura sp. NBRC 104412]